jgi:hypothetical protein
MSDSATITQPLSPSDKAILGKLRDKALFTYLRLYLPLFLLLVYVYYEMQPGNTFRGHRLNYTKDEFSQVYPWFALFFGLVFLFFSIRDFQRMILPFIKEMKWQRKNCLIFTARKYHDQIYDKRLLFYPGKENVYIEVGQKDFDAIGNGESLQLEVGCVTGEVLSLQSQGRVFKEPTEFSFSDR